MLVDLIYFYLVSTYLVSFACFDCILVGEIGMILGYLKVWCNLFRKVRFSVSCGLLLWLSTVFSLLVWSSCGGRCRGSKRLTCNSSWCLGTSRGRISVLWLRKVVVCCYYLI